MPTPGEPDPSGCPRVCPRRGPANAKPWRLARSLHLRVSGEKRTLIDKLGFLVRFWELKARHATLGEPLASREQLELLSLMQLVTGDFKMPDPGQYARPPNALPAQLIGEGTILPVEVLGVSA